MGEWFHTDDLDNSSGPFDIEATAVNRTSGEWYHRLLASAHGTDLDPSPSAQRAIDGMDLAAEYRMGLEDAYFGSVGRVAEAMVERLEYELRGAWRVGYDYLHVYDDPSPLARDGPETFTVSMYFYPGNEGVPRADPENLVYRYSYDLTSVPDDVLRQAIRGDIDAEIIREMVDDA